MKQLIVNADDFGLTAGINRAVIEGHCCGIITSATLMANMPGFDEAVRLAREHPSLDVGLHFNITQGRPVADAAKVRSLIDGHGEFSGTSTALAWRSLAGDLRTEEIVIELRAQIEKVLAAGLSLTHVDSHKHAHALPQVFEAIVRTVPDYGIKAVRLPSERPRWRSARLSPKTIKQSLGALALAQLCRADLILLQNAGLRTTDAFFGITHTGFWTKRWFIDLIEQLPEGVSELMCHPGYEDDELQRAPTRLRASRAAELKLLTDPEIAALLDKHQVKLVNFSAIMAAHSAA
jgi:hopanoid biosynthesis associated protein HpnK